MLVSVQRAEYCWDFGIVTLISQQLLLSCKHSSPSPLIGLIKPVGRERKAGHLGRERNYGKNLCREFATQTQRKSGFRD